MLAEPDGDFTVRTPGFRGLILESEPDQRGSLLTPAAVRYASRAVENDRQQYERYARNTQEAHQHGNILNRGSHVPRGSAALSG